MMSGIKDQFLSLVIEPVSATDLRRTLPQVPAARVDNHVIALNNVIWSEPTLILKILGKLIRTFLSSGIGISGRYVAIRGDRKAEPLNFNEHKAIIGKTRSHLDINWMTFVHVLLGPNIVFRAKPISQELSQ